MAGPAVTMDSLDELLKETERLARHMSVYQHDLPPDLLAPTMRGSEELQQQCDEIRAQIVQYRNQIMVMEHEAEQPDSDVQLFQLLMKAKSLQAKYEQWQEVKPELFSKNRDILLVAGKEELHHTDRDVEMMLSTVRAAYKEIKSDLQKERQWLAEQEEILKALEEQTEQVKQRSKNISEQSAFRDVKNQLQKQKSYKEELLSSFGEFIEEHFPLPGEDGRNAKKQKVVTEGPPVQWVTLHVILETLINQLLSTPNDPYIIVQDEYWPPYIELLLRNGIALRHPADTKRIRLEAFHL
ncbi:centromere protein K [Anomaloglossus baeobatrachus]|uniref:centromere protein K n=1 Tax=Anomaloglossus baeobatrachus TaxID=238106 RepID=UPI003F5041DD